MGRALACSFFADGCSALVAVPREQDPLYLVRWGVGAQSSTLRALLVSIQSFRPRLAGGFGHELSRLPEAQG
ncbi:MAG: hypothetical protein ACI8QC_003917 [Planctomycetota bacterium]|jgi:hypothetical protein